MYCFLKLALKDSLTIIINVNINYALNILTFITEVKSSWGENMKKTNRVSAIKVRIHKSLAALLSIDETLL